MGMIGKYRTSVNIRSEGDHFEDRAEVVPEDSSWQMCKNVSEGDGDIGIRSVSTDDTSQTR